MLNNLGNALKHLNHCTDKQRAMTFLRRDFELRFYGSVSTKLPDEYEPPAVLSSLVFHSMPNKLADGTVLDWDLYLLHRLVQSGKMKRNHLLRELIGAFVTPFFGLAKSENFPWHRFQTAWLFADTAKSMCNRLYELMSQNGQIGARDNMPTDGGDDGDESNSAADGRGGATGAGGDGGDSGGGAHDGGGVDANRAGGDAGTDHGGGDDDSARESRPPQYFLDPELVNLIMPSSQGLEQWSLPINPEPGPQLDQLPPFIRLLWHLHQEDPSQGIFIERENGLCLSPVIAIFDGTTVAGGLGQIGTGDLQQLVGSTERIDLQTVLRWLRERDVNGSGERDDGEIDSESSDNDEDVARVEVHAKRLAPKLVRGVDAYILQSLVIPLHVFFGNFFHILATAVRAVFPGQRVEARYCDSFRYYPGQVKAVDDSGAATIEFDRPDQSVQSNVPRAHAHKASCGAKVLDSRRRGVHDDREVADVPRLPRSGYAVRGLVR